MNLRTIAFMFLLAGFLAVPQAMVAHHAEANFDHDNLWIMKGTVIPPGPCGAWRRKPGSWRPAGSRGASSGRAST